MTCFSITEFSTVFLFIWRQALFRFLPGILKPSGRSKASIKDASKSIVVFVNDNTKINLSSELQPHIIALTTDNYNIEKVYVKLKEQLYCAKDFINAVQITYAIIYVLNFKFPIATETVWNFIGQYFFNMKNVKTNTESLKLIHELENLKL